MLKFPLLILLALTAAQETPKSPIFPAPRRFESQPGVFTINESVPILLPRRATRADEFLANFLQTELATRYGLGLRVRRAAALPDGPFMLIGSLKNPLAAEFHRQNGGHALEHEGYAIGAGPRSAVVTGADDAGAFYGLQSLRQMIEAVPGGARIRCARVLDWPHKPFRGIKLYLPGRENIAYFKRFVRDFMALYKYNTAIVEVNAAMRLERHPEVNAGWLELSRDLNFTRRDRSPGPGRQFQDSANADTADGGVLEKEEVAEIVRYLRQHFIEVIPEIPSLTHAYYLLTRHRELAEIQDAEWPDTYCPSEPRVYPLLFDVLDEYIDVMRPRMVHIGHDEWRMPLGACPRCKGKDPTDLYIQDLTKIYEHLRAKDVQTAIWGDHLIEPLRGKKVKHVPNPKGTRYDMPGAISPQQVEKFIPKDILMFNWFWDTRKDEGLNSGLGEANEIALQKWGFRQVFGNLRANFADWDRRSALAGVIGGAPSSWAATNELNFGKDLMFDFLGCANLLWGTARPNERELAVTIQRLLPGIRRNLHAIPYPSDYDPVVPLSIASARNTDFAGAPAGPLHTGKIVFAPERGRAVTTAGQAPAPVRIGADVSSIVFLHACARPGRNAAAYYGTWNFADTAELAGWYEVAYEDGLTTSVPLRYGINILESGWARGRSSRQVAYEAELVEAADGSSLFAFEWVNPRFGKPVKEVRLRGRTPENPVVLAAVSVVKKRPAPEPKPLRLVK